MKDFGAWVKTRREKVGYRTQQALADAMNISVSLISKIERGEEMGSSNTRSRLAKYLKVDPIHVERFVHGEIKAIPEKLVEVDAFEDTAREAASGLIAAVRADPSMQDDILRHVSPPEALNLVGALLRRVAAGLGRADGHQMKMAGKTMEKGGGSAKPK